MSEQEEPRFGWCVLELMGHRRLAGWVTEEEVAGQAMLRIDIPGKPPVTQYYSAQAVYCVTPTTEATAEAAARLNRPEPVHRWELPAVVDEHDAGLSDDDPDSDPYRYAEWEAAL